MGESESQRDMLIVEKQQCPVCGKNEATFTEYEIEDAYAGPIAIFSINCKSCGFKNSDLEFVEPGTPAEYSVEVESPEDLDIRVIKSGMSEITIPSFRISVDSSMSSEGFISNIEGVLNRFKEQVDLLKKDEDIDKTQRKKLKNVLKGIDDVFQGKRKITVKLKDDTGNSAIISDKVKVKKIKGSS